MEKILQSDIKYLQGVGPGRADLLKKELGITTFFDLLYYFPYKYIDRTRFYRISEISGDLPYIQLRGRIEGYQIIGTPRKKRLIARFSDDTGTIELVWFRGLSWVTSSYPPGKEYIVFGKPTRFGSSINLVHPEVEEAAKTEKQINVAMQAHYSTTEKLKNQFLTSRVIHKLQATLLKQTAGKLEEILPLPLLKEKGLISREDALLNIHYPKDAVMLEKARLRMKFEELFFIQLNLLMRKVNRIKHVQGYLFEKVGEFFNRFYYDKLHFELTEAQKRVMKEIRHDLGSGRQMNRLLQGDVGSGKTLVALMTMLIAADNGYQSALMAPTEILAQQHYNTISNWLEGTGVQVGLLTGSSKKSERKILHDQLRSGEMHILVGTHALIEDEVQFHKLGMVVIDEQHRFGVAQRARLWEKSDLFPHVLVMTATPIPRTLAMTLYGDLDVSVIDEMPPGRKPIKTILMNDSKRERLFGFMRQQIREGRQIYVVYPLISESEAMDYKDLEDGYESIVRAFPPPEYSVSVVHGRMKPREKEISMKHFVEGRAHILVATTVIEVGVDIPNASVMVIESAERFGLSQLHQLRGRVGRGADQSWCILMASYKLSNEARKRLRIMVDTNDGFKIADADLKLRGPGDIEGTQQSGIPFNLRLANLAQDSQILQLARDAADKILQKDPELNSPENQVLKKGIRLYVKNDENWSRIS
ncbi:MAG TPA: ATP-dependent DNA helicase RecG [Bacteroidetes bacterium]|nr:ATP-dependent DNA helicase RecG [Bacteroidota bacterium]